MTIATVETTGQGKIGIAHAARSITAAARIIGWPLPH